MHPAHVSSTTTPPTNCPWIPPHAHSMRQAPPGPAAHGEQVRDAVQLLRGRAARLAPLNLREADALATLYRVYAGMLITVARRIVGGTADAEDVVQDVFARLPAVLHLHRDGSLWGWLRQVTAREALMRVRRASTRREEALPDDGASAADDAARAVRAPESDELRWAIQQLPVPHREVLVLRTFLDLSHQEIAELLECSVTASEVRLCRALKQLRVLLCPRPAAWAGPSRRAPESIALRRAS